MVFLLLSCSSTLDFNIKFTREEISNAIIEYDQEVLVNINEFEFNQEDAFGLNPLDEAITRVKKRAIKIFLKKLITFDDTRTNIYRAAAIAVQKNNPKIYKIFAENKEKLLPFCLKAAVEVNNREALEKILDLMEATNLEKNILLGTKESVELNLNQQLKEGNEAVMVVSSMEIFEIIKIRANAKVLLECVRLEYEDKALKLVDRFYLKERTPTGWTALMYAVESNYPLLISKMVRKVDQKYINAAYKIGSSALMIASQRGHDRIVTILLEAGAKIDDSHYSDFTALMLASQNGHEAVVSLLLQAGAVVDKKDADGYTALMLAAQGGYLGIVNLLLEAGANVREEGYNGQNALILAAESGHEDVVELLLERGAKVNQLMQKIGPDGNYYDVTALILANEQGYQGIVGLLLNAGALIYNPDDYSWSVLSLVMQEGGQGVMGLLTPVIHD